MRRAAFALLAVSSLSACAMTTTGRQAAPAAERANLVYPDTKEVPVVETQHGVPVADPYRWLENDVREDRDVAAWVARQNAVTDAYLATLPEVPVFRERMRELFAYERVGIPQKAGNRYFYSRNTGLQNQNVLFVREGLNGSPRMLIDPNTWSQDGATALAEWEPSEDGRHLVYTVQDGGTDWRTVRVLDVATGRTLADEIKFVKFSGLSWAKDGSGFYYSRFPAPKAGETFQQLNTNQAIYFHRLGDPQSRDRLVFSQPERPNLSNVAEVSDDGRTIIVTSSEGTDERYDITLIPIEGARYGRPVSYITGLSNEWNYIGNKGSTYYWTTNVEAPRLRVVATDISQPRPNPRTLVAEDKATLGGASIVGDKLILSYLRDAKTEVRTYDLAGKPVGKVTLPGIGTAGGFSGDADDPETFFAFTSFNVPSTIYRYDARTNQTRVWAQPQVPFDPADFEVEQRFFRSKDGTRVPLFLVARKGTNLKRPSPTLLYGYGGFNISVTPSFSSTNLAWVEQGGVLAVVNLRGGGEYGKAWHDAGRLANKQNVFDDFIGAGEYLVRERVTSPRKLAVYGRSNGGLLVGAVVNQRPDLFAAALPAVGVMDMLRFNRFTAGRYWTDDYGDPAKPDDFRTLRAYSPYHNIQSGKDYPAVLVTTADTDDRVVPGHSFKYTAALQAANTGPEPKLIRIETRAGHGAGKPTDKIIEEFADMYGFIAHHTGLRVTPAAQRTAER